MGPGRLFVCGKHFVGPDPVAALGESGCDRLVCLCERHELDDRYPDYVAWLDQGRPEVVWHPIPDLHAPPVDRARSLVDGLAAGITQGHRVLMHCGAGIGRAGTMAAALLMSMGTSREEALETVARARPMAGPEAGAQEDLLMRWA